jgi:hypothetical protein
MQTCLKLIYLFVCFFAVQHANAQQDSALSPSISSIKKSDSIPIGKINYSPRKAIVRSAIIPGWGQAINKKYWKIPVVYAALGTTTYLFFRNLNQYQDAKNAYILATDNDPSNDALIPQPYYSVKDQPERIRVFRNQVRQNIDYSVVFFMLFWGLNVVDAAVDAHLKTFDVTDKLSIQIKAGKSNISNAHGFSLIVPLGK